MEISVDDLLPIGKLPANLLAELLSKAPVTDNRVLFGPKPGFDCAVIILADRYLVVKSDPITFATSDIGWYLVQVNANDIATCGATPRWLTVTLLMPGQSTTFQEVSSISEQIYAACNELDISVIGGHSEITHNLDRPILIGTLIGEVESDKLITPQGARPGDVILLTKTIPIEAISILAREFQKDLTGAIEPEELREALNYLKVPGISIVPDAQAAIRAGRVTAMHDPTEGGVIGALWEVADVTEMEIEIDLKKVPIAPLAEKICDFFAIDPYTSISSGSLLMTVAPEDAKSVCKVLQSKGILCTEIGQINKGQPGVFDANNAGKIIARPARDAIAGLFAA